MTAAVLDKTTMKKRPGRAARERTCVGCGRRDDAAAMVRVVAAGGVVVVAGLLGRAVAGAPKGRGAHVHPRTDCLSRAERRLSRALRAPIRTRAREIGLGLAAAADAAMVARVRGARRRGAAGPGFDSNAPLVLAAVDRLAALGSVEPAGLVGAVAEGRAMAWKTESELGALLAERAVAFCSVRDVRIASELVRLRAAADAGTVTAATTGEGAECSRCPEAR